MPEYKLGKNPARHDPRTFDYAKYRTGVSTPPPDAHWGYGLPFAMLANDKYGDCVQAGYAHMLQIWGDRAGNPFVPDDADTLAAYTAITGFNPNDPSSDKGTDMLTAVNYWRSTGMNGHEITAFASLSPLDQNQMKEAIAFFGGAYIGLALPISAQGQVGQEWTVTQGPDAQAGSWGGHCLAPNARVLTADLRWVPIGDLEPGDVLVGFDEDGPRRIYKSAWVEHVSRLTLPCFDVQFADGTAVRAAYDHLWLTDSGRGSRWLRTDEMRPQGPGGQYGTKVLKPFSVWDEDVSRDAGYLAAAFDGEGWLSTGGSQRGIHKMGFAQRVNAMLDHTEAALKERGIKYRKDLQSTKSGYGTDPVYNLTISGRQSILELLGSVRPHRLLERFTPDRIGHMMNVDRNAVLSATPVGEQDVVAIGTSTGTYIAEGMAQHNCIPLCGYDASRLWCVTWGALQSMTWQFLTTYCVTPETRVLTADLRWIPAGTIDPGEMLLAFDEDQRIPTQEGYKRRGRMYRGTAVESVRLVEQPCFELEFADGTVVRCSEDHKWLVYGGGSGSRWITTKNLRCGPLQASHVVKPLDVWDDMERSYEHGYLSAAFDGEGCLTQRDLSPDAKGLAGTSVSFAQKDNAMLDKTKRSLKDLGFSYNEHDRVDSGVHHLSISSRREVLKFLGTVRPERLLAKFRPDDLGLMGHRRTRLVRKEFIGTQTVVAMQTDSKTFFAEGLASHNCDEAYVLLAQEWMQSSGVSPSNLAWGQLLADLANL
jgi:hypothetical protein